MTSLCDLKMPFTLYQAEIMLSLPLVLHSSSLVEKWRNAKRKAKKWKTPCDIPRPQKCVYGYKISSSWSFEMRLMPLKSWDDFLSWWRQSILTSLASKGVKNAPEVKNWVFALLKITNFSILELGGSFCDKNLYIRLKLLCWAYLNLKLEGSLSILV